MSKIAETTVYLVLEPQRDWQGRVEAIRVDRFTLTEPRKLASKHVALKLNVRIDTRAFEAFVPEATIEIADGRVLVTPMVDVVPPEGPEEPPEEPPGE